MLSSLASFKRRLSFEIVPQKNVGPVNVFFVSLRMQVKGRLHLMSLCIGGMGFSYVGELLRKFDASTWCMHLRNGSGRTLKFFRVVRFTDRETLAPSHPPESSDVLPVLVDPGGAF